MAQITVLLVITAAAPGTAPVLLTRVPPADVGLSRDGGVFNKTVPLTPAQCVRLRFMKQGFQSWPAVRVVEVRAWRPEDVCAALLAAATTVPPNGPVIIVNADATTLTGAPFQAWIRCMSASKKPLLVSGVTARDLGSGLKQWWATEVTMRCARRPKCDDDEVPVWHVIGTTAGALRQFMQPFIRDAGMHASISRRPDGPVDHVLGKLWEQDVLYVDASITGTRALWMSAPLLQEGASGVVGATKRVAAQAWQCPRLAIAMVSAAVVIGVVLLITLIVAAKAAAAPSAPSAPSTYTRLAHAQLGHRRRLVQQRGTSGVRALPRTRHGTSSDSHLRRGRHRHQRGGGSVGSSYAGTNGHDGGGWRGDVPPPPPPPPPPPQPMYPYPYPPHHAYIASMPGASAAPALEGQTQTHTPMPTAPPQASSAAPVPHATGSWHMYVPPPPYPAQSPYQQLQAYPSPFPYPAPAYAPLGGLPVFPSPHPTASPYPSPFFYGPPPPTMPMDHARPATQPAVATARAQPAATSGDASQAGVNPSAVPIPFGLQTPTRVP